ncbi:hypothetical protein NLJ89_g8897 [Agrocybe chaxingu]|uniref:Uncharacterized protein n=1 Tax=Agrocybe chaxingu TaxID=84603 RepID=A0A9W8JWR5_9AGAR|nr:hypothetical protein NLJ89_g8897 [Agrocybe chaxingu]
MHFPTSAGHGVMGNGSFTPTTYPLGSFPTSDFTFSVPQPPCPSDHSVLLWPPAILLHPPRYIDHKKLTEYNPSFALDATYEQFPLRSCDATAATHKEKKSAIDGLQHLIVSVVDPHVVARTLFILRLALVLVLGLLIDAIRTTIHELDSRPGWTLLVPAVHYYTSVRRHREGHRQAPRHRRTAQSRESAVRGHHLPGAGLLGKRQDAQKRHIRGYNTAERN